MPLVSITRLRLRSVRFFPAFAWHAARSAIQARRATGNLGVETRKTAGWTFWTLTVWRDENDMAAFRRAPPHRDVMAKLQHWCDEAAYAHWEQATGVLPAWQDAAKYLRASGKLSHVLHPSIDHRTGHIGN